ncbi:uncharacterized protein LOC103515521 [Diaphorina citri]|uniref:Uncharacterized protein LOC103515521 n=1 Tax=Diaphorina citri TaxID=121845 RepID=A0A3Q0JAL5_DIACI|nr:uncharacterized protein LOC103515521 [Diaphorina citri]
MCMLATRYIGRYFAGHIHKGAGEHAYYLNTLLKQALAKGYDHTRMQQITTEYLPHLCIKPITEEDLILKSLPEQLIAAFQENSDVIKNRPRWLNSALRFFNARHDEIMTIFESNLESVDCATVFCLHDMIMDRLSNEDLALSQLERDRLVHLLLNSLTHLSLSEQVKVVATFVEKYAGELCSVFPPSGEAEEWLNVVNNQSSLDEVCSLSLKHILQSPHSTLTKLLTISLKSKPDQSCMALVIQCLVDTLLPHFGNLDLRESALDANQDASNLKHPTTTQITMRYHDEVACIVGILPKLSPVFYLLLINKLKLNQYLKEMLFYSSAVVANHVLEVINKNVKYYELDETLEFYEHIIKVLYLKLKYLELEYHEREGLSNQMESLTIGDGQKSGKYKMAILM